MSAKEIMEYGISAAIAVVFLGGVAYAFRWWLKQIECMKESHNLATQGFIETANKFNTTVANHMDHSEEAHRDQIETLKELSRAVQKLCILAETPNRDYLK